MFGIFCFLATFASINAGGTLKQRDGYHYITGKGCGISTPIKYLEEIPENIEGMSCTIIRPKKLTKSQDLEGLHDHLKFKPIEECEFKNFDIEHGMYESSTESDKFECAKKCRDHDQCEYFIFLESGYCSLRWLLTRQPMPVNDETYSDLVGSYKSCTFPQTPIEACQFHDLELNGGPDSGRYVGKTEDEYECARKCRADEQCQGFLFCTKDFPFEAQKLDCFFKWNFGSNPPFFTYEGEKSGYKSCRNDYNPIEECEYRAMDIPAAQVDSETFLADFPDERACARECQKDVNCEFFVYLTEDFRASHLRKGCVLKFGIDGAELIEQPGSLSSYRTCKFP